MKSRTEIEEELAVVIASALEVNIRKDGHASLLVSGGSTPKGLFQRLSKIHINWDKVKIIPVDERWVGETHPDQNGKMIRENLLQGEAAKAEFISLVCDENDASKNLKEVQKLIASIPQPFTAVVLGLGTDGHTASLFPDSEELDTGMDLNLKENILISNPKNAPHKRITFSRKALLNTKKLFLHCYGNEKQEVLTKAKKNNNYYPYPIGGFIHQDKVKLEVYWAQ